MATSRSAMASEQRHVVGHDHDGAPGAVPHPAQQAAQRLGLRFGQAGRRLVEEEDPRFLGDEGAEFHQAADAGRELGREPVPPGLEAEVVQERVDPLRHSPLELARAREAEGGGQRAGGRRRPLRGERQVLGHGQAGEEPAVLEGAGQTGQGPQPGAEPGDVGAGEADPPRLGGDEAGQGVDQGRLARAVGPDEAHDLAFPDGQRGVIDRGEATEADGEAGAGQDLGRWRRAIAGDPDPGPGGGAGSAPAPAAFEEHRPEQIVALGQVGGAPEKRTVPFSRNTARLARWRATVTDCSTRIVVSPPPDRWPTTSRSSSTTAGARPSDSSSMISNLGSGASAWARASICCCPPDSSPAGWPARWRRIGNSSWTRSVAASQRSRSERKVHMARRRFSATVRPG